MTAAARGAFGVAALGPLSVLSGCGGGGGKNIGRGALTVSVVWPTTTTRFIPQIAQSIALRVREAGTANVVKSAVLARPEGPIP